MENYPLFQAPDHILKDIKARIYYKKNKVGILSKFMNYQKVKIGIGSFIVITFIIGSFFYYQYGYKQKDLIAYVNKNSDQLIDKSKYFDNIIYQNTGIQENKIVDGIKQVTLEDSSYDSSTQLSDDIYALIDEIDQLSDELISDLRTDSQTLNEV